MTTWTTELVRELFVVVYGGARDRNGSWHPNVKEAARRRRVSARTIQRWLRGNPPGIPDKQLQAILRRRRPKLSTLRREHLQAQRAVKMLQRAELGRGRGNINEYADNGWLDQHLLLIVESKTSPVRHVTVIRDDKATRARAMHGVNLVDVVVADTKFDADALRYEILSAVGPWRLRGSSSTFAGTQGWLASAPMPQTPVHVGAQNRDRWLERL